MDWLIKSSTSISLHFRASSSSAWGVIPMWRFFRQANWNGTTCYWLGQRRSKDGENNLTYLCLLLIIQFLSRLCNLFFGQIKSAEGLGVLPWMMNFEKKSILPFLKYLQKCKFDGQTLIKCDFLEGRLPKYVLEEICFSGGKQTIHKVSAAFIVKNCHPRTSLSPFFTWWNFSGGTIISDANSPLIGLFIALLGFLK